MAKAQKLQCDLVMRGGITSGIVYPKAIAKLAETYDFRCIGGTSAGAIAATATAAAAYGAKHGEDHFQTRFKNLPSELGTPATDKKSLLEHLFQPHAKTRSLFKILMALLEPDKTLPAKLLHTARLLIAGYWGWALLGAAIALVPMLVAAFALSISGWPLVVLIAAAAIPAVPLALIAAAGGAGVYAYRTLPETGYGLCPGSSNNDTDSAGVLPLTDWLHAFFQEVANRPPDQPVTFGQLWDNGGDINDKRDIELVLMTTNVTRGVSHRFPFLEGSWGQLFFKKEDFDALFPASVVKWMIDHAAPVRDADRIDTEGYIALPAAPDLPILLGARMSLSFPFLLSAVPLYAADVTATKTAGKFKLERCWFSDGGLTSNFPLHFFDSPLPSRPTFGINLVPETVAIGDEDEDKTQVTGLKPGGESIEPSSDRWKNIYMPSTNASGIGAAARFNKIESVAGFFSALFDTARNWSDTELTAMPGYRDRVVHVALSPNEGGLNLRMKDDVIARIGERGERAGELLAARFAFKPGDDPQSGKKIRLTWDNHRWVRFRSFMAALEDLTRRMHATWEDAERQQPWDDYPDLVNREPGHQPSYKLTEEQRQFVLDAVQKLNELAEDWVKGGRIFDQGERTRAGRSPRPKPILRMMPPGSNDPRVERAE